MIRYSDGEREQRFSDDFLQGMLAFERGEKLPKGKSTVYQRGYNASKQHAENMREMK